jgi:hypothetical protein
MSNGTNLHTKQGLEYQQIGRMCDVFQPHSVHLTRRTHTTKHNQPTLHHCFAARPRHTHTLLSANATFATASGCLLTDHKSRCDELQKEKEKIGGERRRCDVRRVGLVMRRRIHTNLVARVFGHSRHITCELDTQRIADPTPHSALTFCSAEHTTQRRRSGMNGALPKRKERKRYPALRDTMTGTASF